MYVAAWMPDILVKSSTGTRPSVTGLSGVTRTSDVLLMETRELPICCIKATQYTEIFHAPLLQVFLYMRKVYNSLEHGRFMELFTGQGPGPKIRRLLQRFWSEQVVVQKARRYYRRMSKTGRGVTQGYPLSPTVFNFFYAVVRAVLLEICSP